MKRRIALLILVLGAGPACGGDDLDPTNPGPDLGVDIGLEVGPTVQSFELRVEAVDTDGRTLPIAARVACDMPDGKRAEHATDADGRLPLTVDWSAADANGALAFTLQIDGYPLLSYAGITPEVLTEELAEDGALHLTVLEEQLRRVDRRAFVPLRGDVENVPLQADAVYVSASATWSTTFDTYPVPISITPLHDWVRYQLLVPGGPPFQLVAVAYGYDYDWASGRLTREVFGWALAESDGVFGDTTIDIDLAEALEPGRVSGHVTFPEVADTAFFDEARYCTTVRTYPGAMDVGLPTYLAPTVDGVDFAFQWVEPDGHTLMWGHFLDRRGAHSRVWLTGPPTRGTAAIPFLEPPEATVSADGAGIDWTLNRIDDADDTVRHWVAVYQNGCPGTRPSAAEHVVQVPAGVRSTTIPAPPSGIDRAEIYSDHSCAEVILCDEDDALPGRCARFARSRGLSVSP
jgi:hypothetical protein